MEIIQDDLLDSCDEDILEAAENSRFDLVNFVENDSVRWESIERSQEYINDFDESMLGSSAEDSSQQEVVCLMNTAHDNDAFSNRITRQIVLNLDFSSLMAQQGNYKFIPISCEGESPVQSPPLNKHTMLSKAMEYAGINEAPVCAPECVNAETNETPVARSRGRPRRNVTDLFVGLGSITKEDSRYKKIMNNISSIKYRNNKRKARENLETTLKREQFRNDFLIRRYRKEVEKVERVKALMTSLGIAASC